jgi:hypothetical protein
LWRHAVDRLLEGVDQGFEPAEDHGVLSLCEPQQRGDGLVNITGSSSQGSSHFLRTALGHGVSER